MSEIVVTLLFLVKNNQIVLALKKRGFGAGCLNGVGGKLDPDETIRQAMVRETQEEISVTPIEFEPMADIVFDEYVKGNREIVHMHVFVCSKWVGTPTESEEMAPEWFDVNNLPFDKMMPDDKYWLPQVLAGKKITGNFEIDINNVIISHNVKIVEKL